MDSRPGRREGRASPCRRTASLATVAARTGDDTQPHRVSRTAAEHLPGPPWRRALEIVHRRSGQNSHARLRRASPAPASPPAATPAAQSSPLRPRGAGADSAPGHVHRGIDTGSTRGRPESAPARPDIRRQAGTGPSIISIPAQDQGEVAARQGGRTGREGSAQECPAAVPLSWGNGEPAREKARADRNRYPRSRCDDVRL